jgi:hypothetical protein
MFLIDIFFLFSSNNFLIFLYPPQPFSFCVGTQKKKITTDVPSLQYL